MENKKSLFKKKNVKKRAISLIVLMISIVIMIILATTAVILVNNSGIFGAGAELNFKNDVSQYNEKVKEKMGYITSSTQSGTIVSGDEMVSYVPEISDKYKDKLFILDGKLVLDGAKASKNEIKWANEIGIDVSTYVDISGLELEIGENDIIIKKVNLIGKDSEIKSYKFKIDGNDWITSNKGEYTFANLEVGKYYDIYVSLVLKDGSESREYKKHVKTEVVGDVVSIILSTQNWTKDALNVKLSYTNDLMDGYKIQYKISSSNWTDYTESIDKAGGFSVDENTTIYARLYNDSKKRETANNFIEIRNIDKTKPTAPTSIEVTSGINSLKVRASGAQDDLSGVTGYIYSIDGTKYTSLVKSNEEYTFTDIKANTNKVVYAKAVDSVGNESDAYSKDWSTWDAEEKVRMIPSDTNWTNKDVTIALAHQSIPTDYIMQYKIGENGTWQNGYTILIKENVDIVYARLYNAKLDDTIGLNSMSVKNIDRLPPEMNKDVDYNPTKNSIITSNLKGIDRGGSGISHYELFIRKHGESNYKSYTTKENTYTFEGLVKDTLYDIRIRVYDNAGNVSDFVDSSIPTVCTITLDSQGADSGKEGTKAIYEKYNKGLYDTEDCTNEITSIEIPQKGEYTFDGYYTQTGGKGTKMIDENGNITSNFNNKYYTSAGTLYASWKSYTITYNFSENGGNECTKTSEMVKVGKTLDLTQGPTATKPGWKFIGWNTEVDKRAKLNSIVMERKNIVLYAQYSKDVTATCNYYGGTSAVTGTMWNKEKSISIKLPQISNATKDGVIYTPRGWAKEDTANADIAVNSGANVTLSDNATYYANYQSSMNINIYYCSGDGTNSSSLGNTVDVATASSGRYMNYKGNFVYTSVTLPDVVKNSKGFCGTDYSGISKEKNSTTAATLDTSSTTYYAFYTKDVTLYYYNGSKHTSSVVKRNVTTDATKYTSKEGNTIPTPASYDGATFKGWSSTNNAINSESFNATKASVLYAYYQKSITISYNSNGGTGTITPASGTKTYISKAVSTDTSVALTTLNPSITVSDGSGFTRTGYVLSGWNTKADGTGKNYAKSEKAEFSESTTLYAMWSVKRIKVVFMRNISSSDTVTDSQEYTYGVSGQKFSSRGWDNDYTGHNLSGWTDKVSTYSVTNGISSNWINNKYDNPNSIDSSGNHIVNLYGVWSANKYTVVYNGNGATGGTTATSNHTYGVAQKLTKNGYTREYTVTYNHNYNGSEDIQKTATYSFNNWNTKADGTGKPPYENEESVINLTSVNNGVVNLYATWNSASITYVPTRNDSSGNVYVFTGWYKEATCKNSVTDENGVYIPDGTITTLYAGWKQVYYQNTTSKKYYVTLNDAFSEAEDGNVINVLSNATETTTATLASGKTAKLNMNGKNITFNGAYSVYNLGTLQITGNGTIYGSQTAHTVNNRGTLTISGPTINSKYNSKGVYALYNVGTTTLNSGTITNEAPSGSLDSVTDYSIFAIVNTGTFNMSGGSIISKSAGHVRQYGISSSGKVTISSGTIDTYGTAIYLSGDANKGLEITGGKIKNSGAGAATINNNSNADINISGSNDITITSENGKGIYLAKTGGLNISATKISVTGGSDAISIGSSASNTKVIVTAGTYTGGSTGIKNESTTGEIIVEDGKINGTGTSGTGINIGAGSLTLGVKDSDVSTTNPSITGNSSGITGRSVNFYDGIVVSKGDNGTGLQAPVSDKPDNYSVQYEDSNRIAYLRKNKSTLSIDPGGGSIKVWNPSKASNSSTITATTSYTEEFGKIIKLSTPTKNDSTSTTTLTVTYDYNGATGGNTTATSSSTKTTVTKYTFNSWVSKGVSDASITSGKENGVTYYFYTFPTTDGATSSYIATYSPTNQITYSSVTLPTPTRTGYIFNGWYDGTNKVGDGGATYKPINNITLKASWTKAYYQNASSKKYYVTLNDAFSDAASGNTINVIDNATETKSATLAPEKGLTLNMNSKNITFNGAYGITNNGTLSLQGSGTITGSSAHVIHNVGVLNIAVCTITNKTNGTTRAIWNDYTGTVNMSSGTVSNTVTSTDIASNTTTPYAVANGGTFNLKGGAITSTSSGSDLQYGVYTTGQFNMSGGAIVTCGTAIYMANKANTTTNGGTNITGGVIRNTSAGRVAVQNVSNGTLTISGNNTISITSTASKGIYLSGAGNVNITAPNLTVSGDTNAISNKDTGTITISGAATFTATKYACVENEGTGSISIGAGTFNGKTYGINNKSTGTITVTGGTIEASGGTGISIGSGTLTLGKDDSSVSTTNPSITGSSVGVAGGNIKAFDFYDGVISTGTNYSTIHCNVSDKPTGYTVVYENDTQRTAYLAQVYTITLNQWLGTGGTEKIYEEYGKGIYLNSVCTNEKKMLTTSNGITIPTYKCHAFQRLLYRNRRSRRTAY